MSENQVVIRARLAQAATVLRELGSLRNAFRQNAADSRSTSRAITAGNRAVADSYRAVGKASQDSMKQQVQAARESQRAVSNLKRELANMANQAGVGGYLRSGIAALGVAGGASLVASGVRAYDAKQGLQRSFTHQYGASTGARVAAQTRQFSDEFGVPMREVSTSLRQLSNQLEPAMLMRTMRAFTATGFITGADPEGLAEALRQYTQVANFGKLQGDELKIMQERGVNLIPILQAAGLGGRIGSQTNPITFEELNAAVIKFGESADAVKYMGEISEQGSVALVQMQNAITQDLLPALGKEFTPVVKDLAREMPRIVGAGQFLISNWKAVGGSIAGVWLGIKAAKLYETGASIAAARALLKVAGAGEAAAAAQGGGLLGGIFKKRGPRLPKNAGATVWKDTLGQAPLGDLLTGGGAGAASGAMGPLGTAVGAGGVFVAGALALAGVVEGIGRLAGLNYDDTLFGQIENGLAGRGFKSGSQLKQEIQAKHDALFGATGSVTAAERRKAAREKYMGRMSRSEYFMQTGDADIFATESKRQEMIQRRQQIESERIASQERNRQRNWDAQRRRGGTSPRRASIDRANAEANARLNYGAGF